MGKKKIDKKLTLKGALSKLYKCRERDLGEIVFVGPSVTEVTFTTLAGRPQDVQIAERTITLTPFNIGEYRGLAGSGGGHIYLRLDKYSAEVNYGS